MMLVGMIVLARQYLGEYRKRHVLPVTMVGYGHGHGHGYGHGYGQGRKERRRTFVEALKGRQISRPKVDLDVDGKGGF